MEVRKFWNWKTNRIRDQSAPEAEQVERVLELNGVIAEDSWLDDEISPRMFKDELNSGGGNITVFINSPGGDCFAAAEIYNALVEYPHHVTIKIDGLAASAASVIAMAGDTVLASPVSLMMLHNPATIAYGDHTEMERAIELLNEVKESIINAYQRKTGLSRGKLSKLMENETWMNANKALSMGFIDDIIGRSAPNEGNSMDVEMLYSQKMADRAIMNKIEEHMLADKDDNPNEDEPDEDDPNDPDEDDKETQKPKQENRRSVAECMERLFLMKHFI